MQDLLKRFKRCGQVFTGGSTEGSEDKHPSSSSFARGQQCPSTLRMSEFTLLPVTADTFQTAFWRKNSSVCYMAPCISYVYFLERWKGYLVVKCWKGTNIFLLRSVRSGPARLVTPSRGKEWQHEDHAARGNS